MYQTNIINKIYDIFFFIPLSEATQKLPGTDIKIDVKTGYENLLKYYTSGNFTGTEAFELGTELADSYYKEVNNLFILI